MGKLFLLPASAVVATFASTSAFAVDSAYEPPMDLLATQLRDQGYACDKPDKAEMDQKASRPNETVWVVACKGELYRMTVIPNMAAKVEKVGN
jgi:hypothetical protein